MTDYSDVLDFWFGEPASDGFGAYREAWFEKDKAFDAEVMTRFGKDVAKASAGSYDSWQDTAAGTLALIIMLDQFPRNIFRGLPKAYAADHKARSIARRAIDRRLDQGFGTMQRLFMYLPFEHSENLADQRLCVALYLEILGDFGDEIRDRAHFSVYRHCEIIERFGRFPHRNEIMRRQSSAEEIAFLEEPRSSF